MGYKIAYTASVIVTILLVMLGVIQAGNPLDYGITPVIARWLGVITAGLGVLAGVLPSVRRPPDESRKGLD